MHRPSHACRLANLTRRPIAILAPSHQGNTSHFATLGRHTSELAFWLRYVQLRGNTPFRHRKKNRAWSRGMGGPGQDESHDAKKMTRLCPRVRLGENALSRDLLQPLTATHFHLPSSSPSMSSSVVIGISHCDAIAYTRVDANPPCQPPIMIVV